MDGEENSLDDIDLNDLFFDEKFFRGLDNINFHPGQINHDLDSFLSSLINDNQTPNAIVSTEINHHFPDAQQDNIASTDDDERIENRNHDTISQQSNKSQNTTQYKMGHPIFNSIVGGMTVKVQPKANQRSRYASDGPRFLPGSRQNPMSIKLPDLKPIPLRSNQKFGIVATMVTSTDNPKHQQFVHVNDTIIRKAAAEKVAHGCVFDPLELSEILKDEKTFPRFSIICKKYDHYTYDLIPFDPNTMFGTSEKYTLANERNITNAAKGKQFTDDYDLLSYKIIFQLALKEDDTIFISNIVCETDIVHEQKTTTKSKKRSSSCTTECLSEDESTLDMPILNAPKKFKPSTPPLMGLPVTYISSRNNDGSTASAIDHQE